VGRVEVRIEDALALGGRVGLRLALVVSCAVGFVGDRADLVLPADAVAELDTIGG
jgi:hypothetical protein